MSMECGRVIAVNQIRNAHLVYILKNGVLQQMEHDMKSRQNKIYLEKVTQRTMHNALHDDEIYKMVVVYHAEFGDLDQLPQQLLKWFPDDISSAIQQLRVEVGKHYIIPIKRCIRLSWDGKSHSFM